MRVKNWFVLLLVLTVIVVAAFSIANSTPNTRSIININVAGDTDQKSVNFEKIKELFGRRFPGINITKVQNSPMPSLYEVQVGTEVVYVDSEVNYLVQGNIIDTKTRLDLTHQRVQQLSVISFDDLPLELAFKQVRGDGSRKIAIFEDPNCGYCKQLQKSLVDAENVTIYSFLYPILSEDSVTKSRDVLCAKDPAIVWFEWMVDAVNPPNQLCDSHKIEQLLTLGRSLSVRGTPAIFFADGSRVSGALPLDQIHQKLDEIN